MAEVYPGRDEQVKDVEWIRCRGGHGRCSRSVVHLIRRKERSLPGARRSVSLPRPPGVVEHNEGRLRHLFTERQRRAGLGAPRRPPEQAIGSLGVGQPLELAGQPGPGVRSPVDLEPARKATPGPLSRMRESGRRPSDTSPLRRRVASPSQSIFRP
jgi:hypothetical protein